MWWKAQFGRNYWVDKVRIKNRHNCCGGRLAGTEVFIGGKSCGKVEAGTQNGKWYTVKCQEDLRGKEIELKTTKNEYLSIAGIEVWSGQDDGDDEDDEETGVVNVKPNTKLEVKQCK
jgi:hypothetical protein